MHAMPTRMIKFHENAHLRNPHDDWKVHASVHAEQTIDPSQVYA